MGKTLSIIRTGRTIAKYQWHYAAATALVIECPPNPLILRSFPAAAADRLMGKTRIVKKPALECLIFPLFLRVQVIYFLDIVDEIDISHFFPPRPV